MQNEEGKEEESIVLGGTEFHYERNLSKGACHSHENGNPDSLAEFGQADISFLDSRLRGNDRHNT